MDIAVGRGTVAGVLCRRRVAVLERAAVWMLRTWRGMGGNVGRAYCEVAEEMSAGKGVVE